ncbi:MAG: aldo/keto reductase [Bacteroidetes bacterium]|nr:aldo/keto reductase [Bacteroidota bacterium]
MNYRFLGKSGLKVSELSFGSWITFHDQIDDTLAYNCMKEAYDSGVNFFDNAEAYAHGEAELMMGRVIKKAEWKRSDLVISTKIFWGGKGPNDRGLSRKHIIEGADASLKRLQMDYVDLIFCHRPDVYTPIEETVWAMNQVLNRGKAIYWGTSEWSAEQILEAYYIAKREHLIPPLMEQPEYNMFKRDKVEKEFLKLYDEIGLGTTIWSPLASGLLTGKYNKDIPQDSRAALGGYAWLKDKMNSVEGKEKISKVQKLAKVANGIDLSITELALAWCLKNPNVSTVITGASKVDQVKQNMKAADAVIKLTDDIMKEIEKILNNKPEKPFEWWRE